MININNIKYTILNDKCNVYYCFRIHNLLFINLQILSNIEILPKDSLIIFDDINLKSEHNTFALTSTTPNTMANTIRLSFEKNKLILNSSTSSTNKYGHGFFQMIGIII